MTRTITKRAAAALGAFLAASAAAAPNVPQAPSGRPADLEASERLIGRVGLFQPLLEATEREQYDGRRDYREFMGGSYFRVERHLKVGVFGRVQYGARHDDDWFKPAATRPWRWRDTADRAEGVLVLDATPRVELPFLPGRTWTGALKLRWERNFFNGQNSLLAAPELAWFWMDGLAPRATIFLRSETWFPLNFGRTRIYEQWWYLAGLWHARPWLSLGPQIALREETWSTSAAFHRKNRAVNYTTRYRSWVPGLTAVARFP